MAGKMMSSAQLSVFDAACRREQVLSFPISSLEVAHSATAHTKKPSQFWLGFPRFLVASDLVASETVDILP